MYNTEFHQYFCDKFNKFDKKVLSEKYEDFEDLYIDDVAYIFKLFIENEDLKEFVTLIFEEAFSTFMVPKISKFSVILVL